MMTGHASHQVGLDADIWPTPMPPRELTRLEREEMSATDMVASDRRDVNPGIWSPNHAAVIKAAALDPRVERIFVNAAIKKALCRDPSADRAWMSKVRPWWGHDYHFHVRLHCPSGSTQCKAQPPPPPGRLRQGTRLVVQRRCAAPQAVGGSGEAIGAAGHGQSAEGVPTRAQRARGSELWRRGPCHPRAVSPESHSHTVSTGDEGSPI